MMKFYHLFFAAAVATVTSIPSQAATLSDVIGQTPLYGYFVDPDNSAATWQLLDSEGDVKNIWSETADNQSYIMNDGWMKDNQLCGVATFVNKSNVIMGCRYSESNPLTGEITEFTYYPGYDQKARFSSAVYCSEDNTIYGYGMNPDAGLYPVWKKTTGNGDMDNVEYILTLTDPWTWCPILCIDETSGEIYGITFKNNFVKIDKESGEQELLFELDVNGAGSNSGLAYFPETGKFLWSARLKDGASALYAIDPEAQTSELIKELPANAYYAFFSVGDAAACIGVPESPEINDFNFEDGASSGTIDITLPTTTMPGEELSGELTWIAYVNGVETTSGTGAPGEKVTADFENIPDGLHDFAFAASNNGKQGPKVSVTRYVGNDTPRPSALVQLYVDKNTLSAEWAEVYTGMHYGWIDADNIVYEVYLNGELMTETKDTYWEYTIDSNLPYSAYQLGIIVKCNGHTSTQTLSNIVGVGAPLSLPVDIAPTAEQAMLMTYLEDSYGTKWKYDANLEPAAFTSGYYGDGPVDDWLITPPMAFIDAPGEYELSFETEAYKDYWGAFYEVGDEEYFDVWMGDEATADAMTIQLKEKTKVEEDAETSKITFSVESAGTYYIGFHGLSAENMPGICLRNISVVNKQLSGVAVTANDNVVVKGGNRQIQIMGLDGAAASIFTLSGVCVKQVTDDATVNVERGVYVVSVNGKVHKVVVK